MWETKSRTRLSGIHFHFPLNCPEKFNKTSWTAHRMLSLPHQCSPRIASEFFASRTTRETQLREVIFKCNIDPFISNPLNMSIHFSVTSLPFPFFPATFSAAAATAAKSFQSCPTLCNPIDGSPPGTPVSGILQARTLEWVAISFSNAWKCKVKVKSLSRVWLFATPWTTAY